ncbi:predicted protein, partial [Naegleria gruberi]
EQLQEFNDNHDVYKLQNEYGGAHGLAQALGSNIKEGISNYEVQERGFHFGKHFSLQRVSPTRYNSWFRLFIITFKDSFMKTFLILAIISIILGVILPTEQKERRKGWIEGVSLLIGCLFVCVANSFIGWQKKRKWNEIHTLQDAQYRVKVTRDGKITSILMENLVVGDILHVEPGDFVTCSGIVVDSHNLICDESFFTANDTNSLKDKNLNPFIDPETFIVEGYGSILVTSVGVKQILLDALLNSKDEESSSPLETRLFSIANNIWKIAIGFSLSVFALLMVGWTIYKIGLIQNYQEEWIVTDLLTVLKMICLCFSVLFVCTPNGIYKIITTSMAYSSRKTIRDNILLSVNQNMDVSERLGYTSQVIIGKSALTQKSMEVVKAIIAGENIEIGTGDVQIDETLLQILSSALSVNSRADIRNDDNMQIEESIGDSLDCSLLIFLQQIGVDYAPIRNYYFENNKIVKMFTKKNGTMTTIVRNNGNYILFTKGCYESILENSSGELLKEGVVASFTDNRKEELRETMSKHIQEGYTIIAIAYREIEDTNILFENNLTIDDDCYSNLVLISFLIILNPLTTGIKESISQLRDAGIFVRLVTGESVSSAKRLATECGIMTEDGTCLEGPSFFNLNEDELIKTLPNLQVVARANNAHKYHLISELQKQGEFVTILSSSHKDVPSIRKADIGAVCGIKGSHWSKYYADLFITDDRLSSLVRAIAWGRALFYNIQKYLVFHMTINIVVMTLTAVTSITAYLLSPVQFPPFNPVQLLFVHIIMDIFAALSLASDPPHKETMKQDPIKPKSSIVRKNMKFHIVGQILYQLVVLMILHYSGIYICINNKDGDKLFVETMVFNTFIFCQIFNEINCRRIDNGMNLLKNIHHSLLFVAIFILNIAFQVFLVQLSLASLVPLTWYQWLVCVAIGFICVPFGYVLRFLSSRIITSNKLKKGMNKIFKRMVRSVPSRNHNLNIT